MRAEIRSDGLHVSGYVNVPGRRSRPILTGRGRAVEIIEQGAFAEAIRKAGEIRMLKDHDPNRVLAKTTDGTLSVKEDAVGLRAESVVTDGEVIEAARNGKIRGWSFNMRHVADEVETRDGDELPIRHVKAFDMDEISLIIGRIPAYTSMSVEVRGEEEEDVETRASLEAPEITDGTDDAEKRARDAEKDDPEPHTEWKEELDAAKAKIEALKK